MRINNYLPNMRAQKRKRKKETKHAFDMVLDLYDKNKNVIVLFAIQNNARYCDVITQIILLCEWRMLEDWG